MNDCKQVVGQADRWASEGEGDTGARPEAAMRAAGRTGGVKVPRAGGYNGEMVQVVL